MEQQSGCDRKQEQQSTRGLLMLQAEKILYAWDRLTTSRSIFWAIADDAFPISYIKRPTREYCYCSSVRRFSSNDMTLFLSTRADRGRYDALHIGASYSIIQDSRHSRIHHWSKLPVSVQTADDLGRGDTMSSDTCRHRTFMCKTTGKLWLLGKLKYALFSFCLGDSPPNALTPDPILSHRQFLDRAHAHWWWILEF